MKLFFLKSDSLYTIFTTIEKLERHKAVEIYIEDGNQFFLNERRGQQIKELLDSKQINATFLVQSNEKELFLQKSGLQTKMKKQAEIKKALHFLYTFFFNIQSLHLYMYHKKHYILYLMFCAELAVLLIIFYFLYSLILPSTTITLYPYYQNDPIVYNFHYVPPGYLEDVSIFHDKHISIPYHTGTYEYSTTLHITNTDIQYLAAPAEGKIRLVNKTEKNVSLVNNTELVTNNGLIFHLTQSTTIPAATGWNAGYIYGKARAAIYDQNNSIIGERGLLEKGDIMYIEKLPESLYTKNIYAEVTNDSSAIKEKDFVSDTDKDKLSEQLLEKLNKEKLSSITNAEKDPSIIILPFTQSISATAPVYTFSKSALETGFLIQGEVQSTFSYLYVTQEDILKAAKEYLAERPSSTNTVVTINTKNISFLSLATGDYHTYVIPTSINIIQAYDFSNDTNNIKNEIKNAATKSKSLNDLKSVISQYKEIANASIQNRPFRNTTIATTKSRIFVTVEQ